MRIAKKTKPAQRPLKPKSAAEIQSLLKKSLANGNGFVSAHCVHELWMRGEMAINIDKMLEQLWKSCGETVPDWMPMRHNEILPVLYDVAAHCSATGKGQSNIYLVLLDYSDSRSEPHGVYVGMSHYNAAERFDQHKAGIRAAGSVLKRGVEILTGPVLHLQKIKRNEAERIEVELGEALTAAGLFVQGGH